MDNHSHTVVGRGRRGEASHGFGRGTGRPPDQHRTEPTDSSLTSGSVIAVPSEPNSDENSAIRARVGGKVAPQWQVTNVIPVQRCTVPEVNRLVGARVVSNMNSWIGLGTPGIGVILSIPPSRFGMLQLVGWKNTVAPRSLSLSNTRWNRESPG